MDGRRFQQRAQGFAHHEIVNAPACILLASAESVTPPRIDVRLVGIEMAEGVHKTCIQELLETFALLVGETGIFAVGLRIFEVDFAVRHIKVAAEHNGLSCFQVFEVGTQVLVPLLAIVEAAQAVLGIGHVGRHEVEVFVLGRNDAALVVVKVNAQTIGNAQRMAAREYCSARIAFFSGLVPIGFVALQGQVNLSSL